MRDFAAAGVATWLGVSGGLMFVSRLLGSLSLLGTLAWASVRAVREERKVRALASLRVTPREVIWTVVSQGTRVEERRVRLQQIGLVKPQGEIRPELAVHLAGGELWTVPMHREDLESAVWLAKVLRKAAREAREAHGTSSDVPDELRSLR